MALPVGDWAVDANGFRGKMTIRGIDAAGNLDAGLLRPTFHPLTRGPLDPGSPAGSH